MNGHRQSQHGGACRANARSGVRSFSDTKWECRRTASRTLAWLTINWREGKEDQRGTGVIRAVFTTMEGDLRYAVENEGALDFVDEENLKPISRVDLAAA